MTRLTFMRTVAWATIAAVAALSLSSSAMAFFPPPVNTGVSNDGVVTPPPDPGPPPMVPPVLVPPLPTDPFVPPPNPNPPLPPACTCNCNVSVQNTPEPATMISAAIGLSMIGGILLRRRIKK